MKLGPRLVFLLAISVQACGQSSTANPGASPTSPSSPAFAGSPSSVPATSSLDGSPEPSEPATAGAARVVWEHVGLPEPGASVVAGLWDGSRWIVAGSVSCPDGRCPSVPLIWTSNDARTWTRVASDRPTHPISAMTRGADAYLAATTECHDEGWSGTTGVIWRSVDGSDWSILGSIDLGEGDGDCTIIEGLGVTGGGMIAIARTGNHVDVFRSSDGLDWESVLPATFGVPPKASSTPPGFRVGLLAADVVQLDGSSVVLATSCNVCPVVVWRSDDGSAWTEIGRTEVASALRVSVASGPTLVVAAEGCDENAACGGHQSVSALDAGGAFVQVADASPMDHPELIALGDGYLLLGNMVGPGRGALVSLDGHTWAMDASELERCRVVGSIVSPTQALVSTEMVDFGTNGYRYAECTGLWLVDVSRS